MIGNVAVDSPESYAFPLIGKVKGYIKIANVVIAAGPGPGYTNIRIMMPGIRKSFRLIGSVVVRISFLKYRQKIVTTSVNTVTANVGKYGPEYTNFHTIKGAQNEFNNTC
jgi:hypothetical protein